MMGHPVYKQIYVYIHREKKLSRIDASRELYSWNVLRSTIAVPGVLSAVRDGGLGLLFVVELLPVVHHVGVHIHVGFAQVDGLATRIEERMNVHLDNQKAEVFHQIGMFVDVLHHL